VLTPSFEARRIAGLIPGARLELLRDGGHMLMIEADGRARPAQSSTLRPLSARQGDLTGFPRATIAATCATITTVSSFAVRGSTHRPRDEERPPAQR